MKQKLFLSIPEFARLGGLNYKLARQIVLDGTVPSKLIGSRRRIKAEWANNWLSESDAPARNPEAGGSINKYGPTRAGLR